MADAVRIDGLQEFVRNLKRLDQQVPKALRVALNDAADVVIDHARPQVPRRTGRAAASIKARSTPSAVRVAAGGRRAPYYPWLDFGGTVGRKDATKRPFFKEGRYLFPSLREKRPEFEHVLRRALVGAAERAGIEVT